jgi:hypothetical protein
LEAALSPGRPRGLPVWSDSPLVHVAVGALVCLFVTSPAIFTPWGFGADYTNHLWLVWQQGLAISHTGHPTLYVQSSDGIFEPLFGFYGGTLYAVAGTASALLGNHPYPVFVASIAGAAAMAYGGMWWLGRQFGLSRWAAHLPAFVTVTAAYYLTDAYARGAWTELVALSAVPLFVAGAVRLLSGPWRAWPVALFVVGTVFLTGTHNLTLFWSVFVLGPIAVAVWFAVGNSRPPWRRILAVALLAGAAAGINAWFLVLDILHSTETQAWARGYSFTEELFIKFMFFDTIPNVLNPLRQVPSQSTTSGLTVVAPVAAFVCSAVLTWLAWPTLRAANVALRRLWWILMAAAAVLVVLQVMPGGWWLKIGTPFVDIQFPYRLAGWLLIAVSAQLAISLCFARALKGGRRTFAIVLCGALVVITVVQAAAQLYSGPRLRDEVAWKQHPRVDAFANGPTTPPATYYSKRYYADNSEPLLNVPPQRIVYLPVPEPGTTRMTAQVQLPPGRAPVATNVAAGPYAVRLEGLKVVGRTREGLLVVDPGDRAGKTAAVTVVADAGPWQTVSVAISILCLLGCLGLVAWLAVRPRLRYRRERS